MKLNPREKKFVLIGGIVCLLTAGIYIFSLVAPSTEGVASSVEYKKRMLLRERETLRDEDLYKAKVQQNKQRLAQDMNRLLTGDNPNVAGAELQKSLTDLASQSGVEIMQKNIQREQKVKDGLVKVSVRIETNCLPDQLVQLLAAIENHDKYLSIDELVVNSFRMQKRYEIRPSITVSGYILAPETKDKDKVAS